MVCPPGLHKYPVMDFPEDAVATVDNVALAWLQVMTFELLAYADGADKSATTAADPEAVQPLLWVTVTE